jgi:hypothetical protein
MAQPIEIARLSQAATAATPNFSPQAIFGENPRRAKMSSAKWITSVQPTLGLRHAPRSWFDQATREAQSTTMNDLTQKLIVALVVIPVLIGLFRTRWEMFLSIGAIAIALSFANLDRFIRFKTPGFEAELRTVVDKAYAAIEQLKELGLSLSAPIVDDLAMSGRLFQYMPLTHKLDRVEMIVATLKQLGASQTEIDAVTATIYGRIINDHNAGILRVLRQLNPVKAELFQGLEEGKLGVDWDRAKLDAFITSNGLIKNNEIDESFADLDYFIKTKKLRRPERWQS